MRYREKQNKETRNNLLAAYGNNQSDSGKAEVQIAIFTKRINDLSTHIASNKKDFVTQRAVVKLVSKRKRLLEYISRKNPDRYNAILEKLNLRK